MASVVDLPVELLLVLFNLLQPRDVAHVLATCRALRAHALTDSVWRDLAARYGVHDIAHVPEPYHSFRAVYTRLLHSYGPLLGLWASDAPFENAVFRLRWDPGSGMVSAGIIGELFLLRPLPGFGGVPEDAEVEPEDFDLRVPRPPRHVPVLKIGFDAPGESPNVDSANADAYELSPGRTICSFNTPHITSLVGLHAPERRIFLNIPDFVRSPLSHPIYPGANPWLDLSRASHKSTFAGVEILTGEPPGAPTAAEIVQATKALGVFVYSQPPEDSTSDVIHPWALSLSCKCYEEVFGPGLPCLLSRTRWYPLLTPTPPPPIYRASDEPPPAQSFWGLWLGAYGSHGTEILWLEHKAAEEGVGELRAWKVTGDFHVPRGATTWYADLNARIALEELPGSITDQFHDAWASEGKSTTRAGGVLKWVFSGWGTVSGAGFQSETSIPCLIALDSSTRIMVWWSMLDRVHQYIRYEP